MSIVDFFSPRFSGHSKPTLRANGVCHSCVCIDAEGIEKKICVDEKSFYTLYPVTQTVGQTFELFGLRLTGLTVIHQ